MGVYKRKQENTLSNKKGIKKKRKKRKKTRSRPRKRPRKNDNGQEEKKENTLSTKKATKKKEKLSFFFSYFLLFFYKFSTLPAIQYLLYKQVLREVIGDQRAKYISDGHRLTKWSTLRLWKMWKVSNLYARDKRKQSAPIRLESAKALKIIFHPHI